MWLGKERVLFKRYWNRRLKKLYVFGEEERINFLIRVKDGCEVYKERDINIEGEVYIFLCKYSFYLYFEVYVGIFWVLIY